MFGSHLSIAGDLTNALVEAESLDMDTVQVFTKNQQQWRVAPLQADVVERWHTAVARLGWQGRLVAHASYLINLASPDDELWAKSIDLMRVEFERCHQLGISFLVHHPGSTTGGPIDQGIRRIADAYAELFADTKDRSVVACLENTVGAGSTLGGPFEQLADLRAAIIAATGAPERVGFCFDTCHAHAAGHDLSTRRGAKAVLAEFDRIAGLKHIRVLHLNDSKAPLASRRDLHEHIGQGTIGSPDLDASGFPEILSHHAFAAVPKILETPKGEHASGIPNDSLNLQKLRERTPFPRPIHSVPRGVPAPVSPGTHPRTKPSKPRPGKVRTPPASKRRPSDPT